MEGDRRFSGNRDGAEMETGILNSLKFSCSRHHCLDQGLQHKLFIQILVPALACGCVFVQMT